MNCKSNYIREEEYIPSLAWNKQTIENSCVKRYITNMYRREKEIVRDVIVDDEGKEIEILDRIADQNSIRAFEEVDYNINNQLKSIEYKRYKFGVDIFMLLYLRLLTLGTGDVNYRKVLEVLGISKKKLAELESNIQADEEIVHTIRVISTCDNGKALEELEKRVYGANGIKKQLMSQ